MKSVLVVGYYVIDEIIHHTEQTIETVTRGGMWNVACHRPVAI